MIKIILSRKLGDLRITQTELSNSTGIRLSTIGDWYYDMKDTLDTDTLDRICESLDCPVSDIVEWVPNEKPKARKAMPKKYKGK